MPTYGGFESQRLHSGGPWSTLYEATARDGRPRRFALRVFHPPPSTRARRILTIERWLLAAQRQRDAFRAGGPVVEIVECGRCEEGAYAVSPWLEYSLEHIVHTIGQKGDYLRAVATGALAAMEGWEAQYGSPHGNLKPSNVFLTAEGPLTGRTFSLTDASPQLGGKDEALRAQDFHAIGAMLVLIVRRRPPTGWPIEEGPEWRALGRAGAGWLAFCNFLMNPQPAAGELSVAEARRRLGKIPHDARPGRNAALVTGAVIVIGAGSVLSVARFTDPQGKPMFVRRLAEVTGNPRAFRADITADWGRLCRAWGSWLGDLERNGERWVKADGMWPPHDPLRAALERFLASAGALKPQAVVPAAAESGASLGTLANSPPDKVRQQLLRITVAEKVTGAWLQVYAVERELQKWPRWAELHSLVDYMRSRSFTRAADALDRRLPPAPGPDGRAPDIAEVFQRLNEFSLDDSGIQPLAARWTQIQELSADMAASGDRVQKALPALTLAVLTDQRSVGDFADSLADPLAELRRRREHFLNPAVDRARFLKESPIEQGTGVIGPAEVATWEQELEAFSRPTAAQDPRLDPAIDTQMSRLTAQGADLEHDAPAGESPAVVLGRPEFDTKLADLTESLKALRARDIVRRDIADAAAETARIADAIRALAQRVDATLALLKPEVWLARMSADYGDYPAVRDRWQQWQKAALAGISAADLSRDREHFRQVRGQARQVRDWLDGLQGSSGLGALAVPDLGTASPAAVAAIRDLEHHRREAAAAAAIAAAQWNGTVPAVAWGEEGSAVHAPIDAHRAWLAGLPAFATGLDRLGTLLDAGYGWDEGLADTVAALKAVPGLDALPGPLAMQVAEARRLESLSQSNDRMALVAAAEGGGLSQRLTVWRRLGAIAGWPSGPAELDTDGTLVAGLRSYIAEHVTQPGRRDSLDAELARQTRLRWNRAAMNAARDPAQLAGVFERMDRYGIGEADLEDPVAYNLALWKFKRAMRGVSDTPKARELRDGFVAAVRARPGWSGPAITAFAQSIAEVDLSANAARQTGATPARLPGWTEEYADDGSHLAVTWRGAGGRTARLDFLLIQPEDATPPFFLAQREVSAGQFVDLVSASAQGPDIVNLLPKWVTTSEAVTEPFNRPMAWRPRPDFSGIELNPTWMYVADAQVASLLDDPDFRSSLPALAEATSERPTAASPLQQIPPDAARAFAERLVGARLPTPAEWKAVLKLAGSVPPGNVRGRSFADLWHYLETHMQGGQSVRWRPNNGIFLPLVATPEGLRRPFEDDGRAGPGVGGTHLWMRPVDEGPVTAGFTNLTGNVWIYLYDPTASQYYVAGGSALAPPGLSETEPIRVEANGMIGARRVTEGFNDVGVRPALDVPPGLRDRLRLLVLVRDQPFLTL